MSASLELCNILCGGFINRTVKQTILLVFLCVTNLRRISASNLIFLSYPSYSHVIGPANVAKYLQDQGHNVLVAVPTQLRETFQNKGLKLLVYDGLGEFPEQHMGVTSLLKNYFSNSSRATMASEAVTDLKQVTTKIIKDEKFFTNVRNFNADLMILDSAPIAAMLTYIAYKLNVPFVYIGSFFVPQYARNPILPAIYPNEMFPIVTFTDRMTFPERIINTFLELMTFVYNPLVNDTLIQEYLAPNKTYISLQNLLPTAQLWIIQNHRVLDYNSPTTPNVKRVGGLIPLTPKLLPPALRSDMDSATDGVVIVSFGSVMGEVPPQVMDKLIRAFEKTRFKYIVQGVPGGKRISEKFTFQRWIPQYDLLNHKNTKLFITHCGLNSLHEALHAGLPIIGFPVFGDQPQNGAKLVSKGFGLILDLRSFLVEELVSAIKEATENPKYKRNVEKASAILKSERVSSIEEASFWINHVLQFGGDHLRSYAQDVPLWKFLGLDVIAFCLLVWHVLVYMLVKLLLFLFSCLINAGKQKDKED